jgi:diamine N-acetyltransferase
MDSHFEDAAEEPRAKPRMWSVHDGDQLVGFVMISDGIERLDEDLVGPYFLWRLLIDVRFQGRGYGAATIDAVVEYLRTRPGAEVLFTSCTAGDGSPQGFYLRYGFVLTGEQKWGEDILALDLTTPHSAPEVTYYANGKVKHRGATVEGNMHGPWEWFRTDGSVMRTGAFDHGRQVGAWRTYDRSGRVVKETRYS